MTFLALSNSERTQLLTAAAKAMTQAYAPYSNFRVGAAVLTRAGNLFTGCNVENAAYGMTICAEQSAIVAAVLHEGGHTMKVKAVAVVNERNVPCSPCGACRQVLFEFGVDAIALFPGKEGIVEKTLAELLPDGFHL